MPVLGSWELLYTSLPPYHKTADIAPYASKLNKPSIEPGTQKGRFRLKATDSVKQVVNSRDVSYLSLQYRDVSNTTTS